MKRNFCSSCGNSNSLTTAMTFKTTVTRSPTTEMQTATGELLYAASSRALQAIDGQTYDGIYHVCLRFEDAKCTKKSLEVYRPRRRASLPCSTAVHRPSSSNALTGSHAR